MDTIVARKTWRTLEPMHSMVYFAPEAAEAFAAAGLTDLRAGYFASRAAPMGAVRAEVVAATFYNFDPAAITDVIPAAWDQASPEALVMARRDAAGRCLRRVLGEAADHDEVGEAGELARRAALAASEHTAGRPLAAGHAGLEWPDDPLLVLWHAQTILREYRGDGHIALLVGAGLSGIEALVLHAATGEVDAGVLRSTRQWSDDNWTAAIESLHARGLVDGDGGFTDAGRALRARIEDDTDALAAAPYAAIGEEACERLRALARPLSRMIVAAGGLGT